MSTETVQPVLLTETPKEVAKDKEIEKVHSVRLGENDNSTHKLKKTSKPKQKKQPDVKDTNDDGADSSAEKISSGNEPATEVPSTEKTQPTADSSHKKRSKKTVPFAHKKASEAKKKSSKPSSNADKNTATNPTKKPHRFRPGTVALREIRKYQKTGEFLVPRLPFMRLVREIAYTGKDGRVDDNKLQMRWTRDAIEALHEITENYLVKLFMNSQTLAVHAKRITIKREDMQVVRLVNGNIISTVGNQKNAVDLLEY